MSRSGSGAFPAADSAPQMTVEIRLAEGAEADRLRTEQARVIAEVLAWVARRQSENGSSATVA